MNFHNKYNNISLASFVALAKALGYGDDIKSLISKPLFSTMDELETFNKKQNRKRGRNEFD